MGKFHKSDVDGPNSLPLRLDSGNAHFGRLSAARRAARAVYMGSAPRPDGKRGVGLDPVRCINQLSEIAEHVSAKLGTDTELVLEIRANSTKGFDKTTQRAV